MKKAKRRVITVPTVPDMPPPEAFRPSAATIPPPLAPPMQPRMSPDPSAQIQPKITLIQLVFPYPCDCLYDIPRAPPVPWFRRVSPERTSFSSTLDASVLPSPLVLSLIFDLLSREPSTTVPATDS